MTIHALQTATALILLLLGEVCSADSSLSLPCLTLNNDITADVDVSISRDAKTGLYTYDYTISSTKGKLIAFMLDDIAASSLVSSFAGWTRCLGGDSLMCSGPGANTTTSASSGLRIQSDQPPGVVRYSLMSTYNINVVTANFSRIQEFFDGDRQAAADAMDDAMERECPYNKRKDDFERGRTGVVLGPARHRMVPVTVGTQLSAVGALPLSPRFNVGPSLSPLRSIEVLDSRMNALKEVTSEIPGGIGASASAWIDMPIGRLDCDISGILVKGMSVDGEEVWGGIKLKSRPCARMNSQFTVTKQAEPD